MTYAPERRDGKRDLFTVTVEYSVQTPEAVDEGCSKGVCLTTNMSKKGLGLIMDCHVDEGQSIAIYGDNLSGGPLTANVRWCSRVSDGIYRIGLRLN